MPSIDPRKLQAITDPAARAKAIGTALADVSALQSSLRAMRQAAVLELRAKGLSWAQIADVLGMARSRPKQIAEGRTDTRARPAD